MSHFDPTLISSVTSVVKKEDFFIFTFFFSSLWENLTAQLCLCWKHREISHQWKCKAQNLKVLRLPVIPAVVLLSEVMTFVVSKWMCCSYNGFEEPTWKCWSSANDDCNQWHVDVSQMITSQAIIFHFNMWIFIDRAALKMTSSQVCVITSHFNLSFMT